MDDTLEGVGLDYGDTLRSKTHPEWGLMFPRSLVDGVIRGEWINTHGPRKDRPDGLDLDDMECVARNRCREVEPYSDF